MTDINNMNWNAASYPGNRDSAWRAFLRGIRRPI
jgi:hypothetical protein